MYCYEMHCVNSIKIFTIKALFPSEVDDSHEFQYNANKWIRELFYISKYMIKRDSFEYFFIRHTFHLHVNLTIYI